MLIQPMVFSFHDKQKFSPVSIILANDQKHVFYSRISKIKLNVL